MVAGSAPRFIKQALRIKPNLAVRVQEDLRGRALVDVAGVLNNGTYNAKRWVAQLWKVDLDLRGAVHNTVSMTAQPSARIVVMPSTNPFHYAVTDLVEAT